MLAYLFWHRPRPGIERGEYERRLSAFHAALAQRGCISAAFRLEQLPFAAGDGYEDWYLVEDWQALGALNDLALERHSRRAHDQIADSSTKGWGAVYRLLGGQPDPPEVARWLDKPTGVSSDAFLDELRTPRTELHVPAVWQRQLVLGPAAEFCLAQPGLARRERVWPSIESDPKNAPGGRQAAWRK